MTDKKDRFYEPEKSAPQQEFDTKNLTAEQRIQLVLEKIEEYEKTEAQYDDEIIEDIFYNTADGAVSYDIADEAGFDDSEEQAEDSEDEDEYDGEDTLKAELTAEEDYGA